VHDAGKHEGMGMPRDIVQKLIGVFVAREADDLLLCSEQKLAVFDKPIPYGSFVHHLDTPLAAQNGQLYIDDLYVFSGDDSTVFIMDVNSNITGVHVKPGFHHETRYEFKVHFDGADFETLTYRVSFGEAGPDGRQAMKLHALTGREAREDSAAGELVLEGRTGEPASAGGARLWAGRIADPFYIDLISICRCSRKSTGQ